MVFKFLLVLARDNPTNLKWGDFLTIFRNFKEDSLLEYPSYISYLKPLVTELEKGRSWTVLGHHFSHVSIWDDPQLVKLSNHLSLFINNK